MIELEDYHPVWATVFARAALAAAFFLAAISRPPGIQSASVV